MVCITRVEFRHSNFSKKEGTIHSVSPFSYCYTTKILTDLLLVKMKGNISKKIIENMKRRESLKSKPSGSQAILKFDCEEK